MACQTSNSRKWQPNILSTFVFASVILCGILDKCPTLAQQNQQAPPADDLFSSAAHLHKVFLAERNIAEFLKHYVGAVETKLAQVKSYLAEYNRLADEGVANDEQFVEKIVGNPIHTFKMVKRFAVDLSAIWKSHPALDHLYLESEIGRIRSTRVPEETDLAGAAYSLARVHHTYNLNLTDFTQGNVWGFPSKAGLTALDCLYVGRTSYDHGMHARAVEWFEESYRLAGLERNATVDQNVVLQYWNMAVRAHDDQLAQRAAATNGQPDVSFLSPLEGGHLYLEPVSQKPPAEQQQRELSAPRKHCVGLKCQGWYDEMNYHVLCRGKQLLSDKALSKLKCYLETKNHPFHVLKPTKTEELHRNPDIILLHDLLSDREIEHLKALAEPSLSRSSVTGDYGAHTTYISDVRTSKNSWFDDSDDPVVAKMTKQVARLTGLSMEGAEKLQMANYGLGGHFHSHYDTLFYGKTPEALALVPEENLRYGDRTATLMYYLTDVARGGATVFPKLGVGTWPRKGGAVFWHNIKKNGEQERLVLHGACPVVHGTKWVANKWIRTKDQVFKRRCSLDPAQ
ncbi:unnamed protein product [Notodromas monacha]|uniref:procollagen-proline 4-dioxygenase n=1 Tax=Notodromas monacha TaxID=399045 RepID=A0A7R9BKD9_9CRUS|nr:unnamed protein product [Notodromas monacha]CAG0916324.1 unnamed protein product [Notodromas monacha]